MRTENNADCVVFVKPENGATGSIKRCLWTSWRDETSLWNNDHTTGSGWVVRCRILVVEEHITKATVSWKSSSPWQKFAGYLFDYAYPRLFVVQRPRGLSIHSKCLPKYPARARNRSGVVQPRYADSPSFVRYVSVHPRCVEHWRFPKHAFELPRSKLCKQPQLQHVHYRSKEIKKWACKKNSAEVGKTEKLTNVGKPTRDSDVTSLHLDSLNHLIYR